MNDQMRNIINTLSETNGNIGDMNSGQLHSTISSYLEHNGAKIEDWQDQARLIGRWLLDNGASRFLGAKAPQTTGLGTYMYMVNFVDADGETKWLGFDDEGNVADISAEQPNPASYS